MGLKLKYFKERNLHRHDLLQSTSFKHSSRLTANVKRTQNNTSERISKFDVMHVGLMVCQREIISRHNNLQVNERHLLNDVIQSVIISR
jgi:archaellum component FlaF (FlaF/FlaG flagellin family)